jgi:hypothetical protein
MAIESIPVIVESDVDMAVEEAMDIAMVFVAATDVVIVMPDMDMLSILMKCNCWYKLVRELSV